MLGYHQEDYSLPRLTGEDIIRCDKRGRTSSIPWATWQCILSPRYATMAIEQATPLLCRLRELCRTHPSRWCRFCSPRASRRERERKGLRGISDAMIMEIWLRCCSPVKRSVNGECWINLLGKNVSGVRKWMKTDFLSLETLIHRPGVDHRTNVLKTYQTVPPKS